MTSSPGYVTLKVIYTVLIKWRTNRTDFFRIRILSSFHWSTSKIDAINRFPDTGLFHNHVIFTLNWLPWKPWAKSEMALFLKMILM